jgi:uncharacterized membrane protein (UPF0136 family)
MDAKYTAGWIKRYGCFLILAGIAGWLSNPEKAQTALISGGTFGTLAVGLGFIVASGRRWALWVTLALTGMLGVVFTIRSTISWRSFLAGNDSKLFAACLITAMLLASVALLPVVVRALRAPAAPKV